jgi:hypothetical protein
VPERDDISSATAWAEATSFLRLDLPFHAHEVFEQRWRCCPPGERDCWRALAQWGAALTPRARGNPKGSREVAARAIELLGGCEIVDPIDAELVMASLKDLAAK